MSNKSRKGVPVIYLKGYIMKVVVEFTDEEIQKVLSYGDLKVEDMSDKFFETLAEIAADSFRSRVIDEPHYAYDDFHIEIIRDL